MSTLKTGALRGTSGTADSVQLHASNQSVTFPGAVTITGALTASGGGVGEKITQNAVTLPTDASSYTWTGIPSTTKQITLTYYDVTPASNGNEMWLQVGNSSGIQTSGYGTISGYIISGNQSNGDANHNGASSGAKFMLGTEWSGTSHRSWGTFTLRKHGTGNIWIGTGSMWVHNDTDWVRTWIYCNGYVSISNLDRIKLYNAGGGNYATGTADLQWVS